MEKGHGQATIASTTVYYPRALSQSKLFKPSKRHRSWDTGAPIQERSEGVTQAAAVYNLTEQILVQNAGGQRALRGRPLRVRNAESQERNSMARGFYDTIREHYSTKAESDRKQWGKQRAVQESQGPNMKQAAFWQEC